LLGAINTATATANLPRFLLMLEVAVDRQRSSPFRLLAIPSQERSWRCGRAAGVAAVAEPGDRQPTRSVKMNSELADVSLFLDVHWE